MKQEFVNEVQRLRDLFRGIADTRKNLLDGLKNVQLKNGSWPTIYPDDKRSHHWTTSQCLRAILTVGEYPKYFNRCVDYILANYNYGGWQRVKESNLFDIYCSSDAIMALTLSKRFEPVKTPLEILINARNNDCGWGIVKNDNVSKIRPTCWALQALLLLKQAGRYKELITDSYVQESINFLIGARAVDGGWDYTIKEKNSNTTATSWVLYTLLKWKKYSLKVDINCAKPIDFIKSEQHNGHWRGTPETIEILVDNDHAFHHRAAGLGTSITLLSLATAASEGIIPFTDKSLVDGLYALFDVCKEYKNYKGSWIIPSSLGEGRPAIWDSAYALIALHELNEYLLYHLAPASLKIIEDLYAKDSKKLKAEIDKLKKRNDFYKEILNDVKEKNFELLKKHYSYRLTKFEARLIIIAAAFLSFENNEATETDIFNSINKVIKNDKMSNIFLKIGYNAKQLADNDDNLTNSIKKLCELKIMNILGDKITLNYKELNKTIDKIMDLPGSAKIFEEDIINLKKAFTLNSNGENIQFKDILNKTRQKIIDDGYKIKNAKEIRGEKIDIIGEKGFFKTSVAIAKLFENKITEDDFKNLLITIKNVKESEKIDRLYLFASSVDEIQKNEIEKLIETIYIIK